MEKATYKNALRSKRVIKDAFLHLICEKNINQIRIREIIEIADISKGTFYSHYQDIYAVLEEIENESIKRITNYLVELPREDLVDDFTPLITNLLGYIEANYSFYEKLFNSSIAYTYLTKLQNLFVDFMMKDRKILSRLKSEVEARQFFSFIAVGTAHLLCRHFINKESQPLKELITTLNNWTLHGIESLKKN